MTTLIPHGVSAFTRTGVGLCQGDDGRVFATSPCCGERFEYSRHRKLSYCLNCGHDYTELQKDVSKNLSFDFRPAPEDMFDSSLMRVYSDWLCGVTQNRDLRMEW